MREIFRLVDWMMHLREDLEERFRVELTEWEEKRQMPYVTSIERLAEARGKAAVLLAQLEQICGIVSAEHQERVRKLPSDQLEQLATDLLHFESLSDLQIWLDRQAALEQ